ncbi:MAG: T9SS type A sorting domain-containing protein, partial [Bacteroidia bacterium]
ANIVFNSVRMNGGTNSSAIQIPSGGNITLLNNVFANESTGTANHAVNIATTLTNISSNYNNLYAAGPNIAPTFTTLSAYTASTGRDANSVSALPQFTSVTNLYASAAAMNNSATPLSYVTADINGVRRSVQFPDIGAFEQLSLPVAALGSDTAVCDSIVLQSGNNPGSTILWSTGATTSAITVTSGGSYWLQITNALGSARDTIVVTVNTSPVVTASAQTDSVCAGGCVQLQTQVSGGTGSYVYVWQPAAGLNNATVAAPQACISAAAVYTVSVTDSAGCSASGNAIALGIYSGPILASGAALSACAGDTVLLSATAQTPGCSFAWQPAVFTAQSSQAQTLAWPPQGITTFTVTAVTAQGCADTAVQQVTMHALPPVPVITQNGPQLFSSAATGNQWYLAGQPIAGAAQPVFQPLQNGSYEVAVTDSNGCTSFSAAYLMLNTGIGNAFEINEILLYPNPASDQIFLYITQSHTALRIFNSAGQIIYQDAALQAGQMMLIINTWPAGMYYLQATGEDGKMKSGVLVKYSE